MRRRKQILVIARDWRAAREEARYQALKIAPPTRWGRRGRDELVNAEEAVQIFWAPPGLAAQQMVGLRLDEIIIVGDWVRWDFGAPGSFCHFAHAMKLQMAEGATRRWER